MEAHTITQSSSNYLPALNCIVTEVVSASDLIHSLYQKNHLSIELETTICLYSRLLGYIIHKKIIGDQDHLSQLIIDTIQEHVEQGKNFYHTVKTCTDQNNSQLDDFMKTHGVIVMPILKLVQFTSDLIKNSINNKNRSTSVKETVKKETLMYDSIEIIFENTYQKLIQDIHELNVTNPLIFLLEHFSVMLGWLIGFFTQLTNKPTDYFTKRSSHSIKSPNAYY